MIRAFAPGMTMQDPIPQAASTFDVRQEPTDPVEHRPPPGSSEAHGELAPEVGRLEELLLQRTRERRELAQELDRRSALLRDACARLSELAPRVPELQLREERDRAVARAIEAEVARAEATFKLDEVLGQLLATGAQPRTLPKPAGDRSREARIAELEEQKQTVEARLVLLEDQLGQEQMRASIAARERVEAEERFEFELSQARAYSSAAEKQLRDLRDARSALLGERDGLRARLLETESAFGETVERFQRALHKTAELQDKLDDERGERAAQTTRSESLALRAQELANARTQDQEQLRTLQYELDRERVSRGELAEAMTRSAAELAELLGEVERERTARAELSAQLAAAEARALPQSDDEWSRRDAAQQARLEAMRACLLELRLPLVEFETKFTQIATGKSDENVDETTLPGMVMDNDALTLLDEQLRLKEARIAELEEALRIAQQNEIAAKTAVEAQDRAERAAAREAGVSTLKGELIDVRASATRLSDDLAKERSRRRKMGVTVRALQAAVESGEAPGPWIEELIALVNEGASVPPKT